MKSSMLVTVLVISLAGCSSPTTPCKIIEEANWTCNLALLNSYRPGTLVYVEQTASGKRIVPLPQQAQGFEENKQEATLADIVSGATTSFGVSVLADNFPGTSKVQNLEGQLSAAGFETVDYKFTNTTIVSLKVSSQTGNANGAMLIDQARAIAGEYITHLAPVDVNGIKKKVGNRTVWLVMQIIESDVIGELKSGRSANPSAAATVSGIGIKADLDTSTSTTYSIRTKVPQIVALRAIPLVIEGNEIGPMAAERVSVAANATYGRIE